MTGERDKTAEGRALWRKARRAEQEAAPLDDLGEDEAERAGLLAAYLDGRLDQAEQDRVEAWLAADAAALDSLIVARAALGAEAEAPAGLVTRAQGLMRERRRDAAAPGPLGWLRDLFGSGQPLWQPVGLAAALLLACIAGFELGQAGYASVLSDEPAAVEGAAFDLASAGDEFF